MRIDPTPFLSAVLERKLLEPPLKHTILEGNFDRRAELHRSHFRVEDAVGCLVKLTIGIELAPLRARADAFHSALPEHSPATRFFFSTTTADVWAQDWIEAPDGERAIGDFACALETVIALDHLEADLETTAQPSSGAAWEREYEGWSRSIAALPCWSSAERGFLLQTLLPWLGAALREEKPKTRWSNGDFTSANLKLTRDRATLLDFEYAQRTHFYREDHIRFLRLSPIAHLQPGFFAGLWSAVTPAWEIFFQLRQLSLELAANSPEYLAREVPRRKSYLHFAIKAAGLVAEGWSQDPLPPPPEFASETVQLFWRSADTPWDETNSRRSQVRCGQTQFVAFRIPTGADSLRLDPSAGSRAVIVKAISVIDPQGNARDCVQSVKSVGAALKQSGDGVQVTPDAADAQLLIPIAEGEKFLLAQIFVFEDQARTSLQVIHHVESARWLIQNEYAIEIAGWCFCPERELESISASVGGVEIATFTVRERPDVRDHHQGNAHALRSGFKIHLPLLELEAVIELRAVAGSAISAPFFSVRAGDLPDRGAIITHYAEWARARRSVDSHKTAAVSAALPSNHSDPLVSLLLPVYNTPPRFLRECVDSVLQQIYPRWELRIIDDGSTREGLRELLEQFAKRDARISVEILPGNQGISYATNRALLQAQGEFVGFIDHDDRLHPEALAEVVRRLAATQAVAVYTDEEKITSEGELHSGIFKPAFSPELLCGVMYIGHFLCVRTSVARAIGGFNAAFDGIQDFEFALRLSEQSRQIEHIPKVLYQWRMSPASSAQSGNIKGDMDRLQLEAVTQHLKRTQRSATLVSLGGHRLQLVPAPTAISAGSVIIVRDESFLRGGLVGCAHEIVVLKEATIPAFMRLLHETTAERFVWINEPIAADSASAIESLLGFLEDRSVGATAPVLLANDGKVFASGAIITAEGKIVPAMRGFSDRSDGYNGSLVCNREVSAVLASCVAGRTKEFLEVMSETANPFSDAGMAGICVALRRRGLRVVACGAVKVRTEHTWHDREKVGRLSGTWDEPYYNPHLDAEHGDYRLKEPRPTS